MPTEPTSTVRVNTTSQYPGLFYSLAGTLTSGNVWQSVLTIRLFNALLATILIICALAVAPTALRRTAAIVWLITAIPMALFFIPSTNPSSWAIIGIGTAWVFLISYLRSKSRYQFAVRGALFAISGAVAVGARADSAAYFAVLVALFSLMTIALSPNAIRTFIPRMIPLTVGMVVAVVVALHSIQSAAVVGGGMMGGSNTQSPLTLTLSNATGLPVLWFGAIGNTSLGWFDTPMPAITGIGVFAVFAALFFSGLRVMSKTKAVSVGGITLLLIAIPLIVLTKSHHVVGEEVQPRYLFPLLLMLTAAALLIPIKNATIRLSRTQRYVVITVLAAAQAAALSAEIRRYTTSFDIKPLNPNRDIEWWSSSTLSPVATLIVASVAFTLLAIFALCPLEKIRRPGDLRIVHERDSEAHSYMKIVEPE